MADLYSALRLKALLAATKPDDEADIRYIQRWYSKTFHTPLHLVAELDPADVYLAYYEETYGEMSEDERSRELFELLERPEERRVRMRQKDEERAEILIYAKIVEKEEAERRRLEEIEVKEKKSKLVVPGVAGPLSNLKNLPPEIEMRFAPADEFDLLADQVQDGPKKKG